MAGMFDDIPNETPPSQSSGGGGMFDDIPAEKPAAGRSNMVESEGMLDAMRAVKAAAKGFISKFTEPSEAQMTGNLPVDLAKSAAELSGRAFTGGQEAIVRGAESLGPKVDPLLGKIGLGTMGQLGRDVAAAPEAEFGSAGAGLRARPRAPSETARTLENIARETRGEPPAGPSGAAGPPREPTFPPATGPEPPGYAPPEPLARGRPGLDPNVRLLPPDLPAGAPVRDSAGAARAQSALEQASPEAVRILEDQARQEGWTEHTLDQLEGEQSPHHFLGESSPNFEALTKANQTLPGAARTEIRQAVNQRHRERGDRVNAIHDEYLGPDVDRTQWETQLRQAAQNESRPFWQQFDQQVVTPTPEIEAVLQRPGMRRALAAANDTLLNRGLPVEHGFPFLGEEEAASFADNAARTDAERQAQTRVPTARAFQLAKEHIDGIINDAVRSGKTQTVRTYTQLKRDLDAAIAAHPNADIARIWQQARQTYRGPMALINAREIGEGLLNNKTHYTEVPGILDDMGPEQQAALRLGLRNHMADIAGRPGAGAQLRNIREGLGPDNQRKIAAVIGPDRADAYINALQQEEHMHFGPQRLIQGSDTGQNIAYRQLLEPPGTPSLLSRAVGVGTDLLHPRAAAARMAREALERGDEAAAGRLAQSWQGVRADLGRLLTTQGPERDAIRRALVQRIQEEGGLAGPVGRQPLTPQVLERGRSGRPIKRTPLPIGTEGQILERAEQRLGEGPRVVGSQKEMDDILRKNWKKHGREIDYDDPGVWEKLVGNWNKKHPERQLDPDMVHSRSGRDPSDPTPAGEPGRTLHEAWTFERNGEPVPWGTPSANQVPVAGWDEHVKDFEASPYFRQTAPYPGAKEANRYFAEDQPELTAFTSHRQMRNLENETGIQLLPDKMQAMAFSNEPTRRRFLQGMASTLAAANPELGKIAAGVTKATAVLPRLEDAGYGRSLARQAMYMLGDDKKQAAEYLLDELKQSRPGSVVEKANRDALRHITSGDVDKEPGIWAKSVAEMRAHDETIRAAQAARRAAEEGLRGSGELRGGPGELEAPRRANQEAGRATPKGEIESEPPLEGLPRKVSVPGVGKLNVGPHQPIRDLARQYMADAGLPYNPPKEYAKVDPVRAARIADEYEKMAHAPNDPEVKAAYDAMAKETIAQWNAIKKTGFKAEFIPPGTPDPYAASPRLAVEDIKKNNHMWVFSTRDGFGTLEGFDPSTNPLLADTGEVISGKPALVNDIFRIVHDYFGHAKEGVGFRADGEENAWRSHAAMYSPLARKAMTSETRGQNSWLNYGPYGEANRTAKTEGTVFADQKTGILPDWVVNEGSGQEGQSPRSPLARDVTERGRSGRPIKTTPMETGREADVLGIGAARTQMQPIGRGSGAVPEPANLNLNRQQRNALQDKIDSLYNRLSQVTRSRKAAGEDIAQTSPFEKNIGRQIDEAAKQLSASMEASEKFHNPENPHEVAEYWLDQHRGNAEDAANWMKSILRVSSPSKQTDALRQAIKIVDPQAELALPEPAVDRKKSMFSLLDQLERLLGGNPEKRARGGRVAAPLSARKKYHYAHDRGSKEEHCSNCSMFRKPHGCTAVGGFIAKMGKCDIWEQGREQRADGGSTFRSRLPEVEGEIEDRRDDPPMPEMSRLHGTMVRMGFPTERSAPKPGAGILGKLQFDAGINDIRKQRADGGAADEDYNEGNAPNISGDMPVPYAYPTDMRDVSKPLSERLPADRMADIEERRGETPIRERQHAWKTAPFPLGREIWDYMIQRELGTNWTAPWDRIGRSPARLYPKGQLPKDLGSEDIDRPHRAFGGFANSGSPSGSGITQMPWFQNLMRTQGNFSSWMGNRGAGNAMPSTQPRNLPPPTTPKLPQIAPGPTANQVNPSPNPPALSAILGSFGGGGNQALGQNIQRPSAMPSSPPTIQTTPVAANPSISPLVRARGGRVEPTDGQKKAGNYKKRHINIHGLDISIENDKGTNRSGVGKDGKKWSVKMPYHYGYIRRTEGADGDHVDVCLGSHLKSDRAFVIDQHDADSGRFDEHKVMLGFGSAAQARAYYRRGFSDGRGAQRLGHMREMTIDEFKHWLKNGDTSKPIERFDLKKAA